MSQDIEPRPATGRAAGTWISRLCGGKRNPFQSSYWALYGIVDDTQSRLLLVLGLLTAVAAGVPLPLIAVVFKDIIESFPPEQHVLDHAIYQIVGISFTYFIITFAWSVIWGELGRRISHKLQNKLVEKVLGLDQAFFDADQFDITSILVSDIQTIQRGTSEKVGLFIQSCSYFVATFITGFILNAALTGVLFATIVPAIVIITYTGSSLISKYSIRAAELTEKAASVAESAVRCVLVVQAFGVGDQLSDKHTQLLKSAARCGIKKVVVGAVMLALVFWACYSLNALAFYWGSRIGGSSGTIFAVVFLVLDASFVFNQVGPFIQTIALAAGASIKVFALLNHINNNIQVYSDTGVQISYYNLNHGICFEDVSFCYPARPSFKALHELNLVIPGGKSTAIVGLSGSGKSTLASLVLRLYDPNKGCIKIGGHDLRDLHLTTFRSHIAVVQQNPVIFSGTILDNIRCGIVDTDDLSEAEIQDRCLNAARDAHCDFIESLQNGINTFVSSTQGLSGGQRQRLCMARALVGKPALLILDEPTSALDSWSERKIEESLKAVMKETNTTVITIAHRLATIRNYSKIVVMGDGQVLEEGTHDELLEKGVHYKALVDAQQLEQTIESIPEPPHLSDGESSGPKLILSSSDTSLKKLPTKEFHNDQQGDDLPDLRISNMRILKYCFQYLQPERNLLFTGTFAAIVQGCVIVGEAIMFGHLISLLNTAPSRDVLYNRVDFFSLMFFIISLVAFTASALNGVCFGFVSESFVLRMRDILLRTILIQDQAWFQEPGHTTTKLIAGINQNSNSIAAVSGPILQTLFATLAMVVSGMVLSFISTPLVTVVALSYVPAIMLSGYVRVKMLSLFNQRYAEATQGAAAIACEAVQNIKTVAAFGLETDMLLKYDRVLRASYWRNFAIMAAGNLALSFSYSVIFFLYPLVYWWGSKQVRDGQYSQESFFISLPAIVISSQQCGQFFTVAPEITSARAAAQQVFRLLENKPKITNIQDTSSDRQRLENAMKVIVPFSTSREQEKYQAAIDSVQFGQPVDKARTSGPQITLRDVTFSYPTRPNTTILQGINLHIPSGHFVAFVGPSGAGKSSLIAILERFFDPSAGKVFVDNKDIRSIPVDDYRSQIGLVPQEPELFAGSVSFNVSLGAQPGDNITQEQIEQVCKSCGIHEFIMSLPEGYSTECGSQGSKLSGGQRQRIAVARALIRNPRILLLDEATASLDSHSEKEIREAVNATSTDRTTIVVSHRLSTIQHADNIFVFDNGMLVDQGTHAELVQKNGIYNSMVQAQALG